MHAEEELSRAIIRLMLDEPFFAHFLGQVSRITSKDITKTAAVGLRNKAICLFINPDFFLQELKTSDERIAVLKHEVLHLVFKHLFRHQASWNSHVANVAADLVVNQYVAPWPLPEGAILLEQFDALDLESEKTVEHYYEKLIKAKAEAPKQIAALDSMLGNEPKDSNGSGDKRSKEQMEREKQAWEKIKDILEGEQNSGAWMDDHEKWSDQPGDEAEERQIEDALLKAKDRTKAKDWGNAPGWLQDLINSILERRQPQVDWRRSLRLFANNSRRTRITGTVKRFSKRFGDPNPGIKVKRFQRMAVIIDTSGSVDDESLSTFFSEIHGMWKNGAEIIVIECDAAVQRSYSYNGKTPEGVAGRGGTTFDPAFQHLWERRKREILDGCIYLTDGYAEIPQVKPPCKLLWVLTPDGTDEYLAFGSSVQLDY